MAVSVKEKKVKLKTIHTENQPDGTIKRRSITIANVDSNATPEDLYSLGKGIDSLVSGSIASIARAQDEYYEEV